MFINNTENLAETSQNHGVHSLLLSVWSESLFLVLLGAEET